MGLETEVKANKKMVIDENRIEDYLSGILSSREPFDSLNRVASFISVRWSNKQSLNILNSGVTSKEHRLRLALYQIPNIRDVIDTRRAIGFTDSELISESFLALFTMDPAEIEKNKIGRCRVSTYIRRKLAEHLDKLISDHYEVSVNDVALIRSYFDARTVFLEENGQEASCDDLYSLTTIMGVDKPLQRYTKGGRKQVKILEKISRIHDKYSGSDLSEVAANLTTNTNGEMIEAIDNKVVLQHFINNTPLRKSERKVLASQYGLIDGIQRSYEEIGNDMGMTTEKIGKSKAHALGQLRTWHGHYKPKGTPSDFILAEEQEVNNPKTTGFEHSEKVTEVPKPPIQEEVSRKREVRRVGPEIKKTSQEFRSEPDICWSKSTLRRYLIHLAKGGDRLSEDKCPQMIKLPEELTSTLLETQSDTSKGIKSWLTLTASSSKNSIRLNEQDPIYHPDKLSPQSCLDMRDYLLNQRLQDRAIEVGTVHNHVEGVKFPLLGFVDLAQHSLISSSDLYRFLVNDQNTFAIIVGSEYIICVVKTKETLNLSVNDRYVTPEVFARYWQIAVSISPGFSDWKRAVKISRSHNLILYSLDENNQLVRRI